MKTTTARFDCTPQDHDLIASIVRRAIHFVVDNGLEANFDGLSLCMDLAATHNDCPLDFQALLDAPNGDFCHDVFGIVRHLDRDTGKLTDCFVPRYAARPSLDNPDVLAAVVDGVARDLEGGA